MITQTQLGVVNRNITRYTSPTTQKPSIPSEIRSGDTISVGSGAIVPGAVTGYPNPTLTHDIQVGGTSRGSAVTLSDADVGAAITDTQNAVGTIKPDASATCDPVTIQSLPKFKAMLGANIAPGTDPGHGWIFNNVHFDSRGPGADGNLNGLARGLGTLTVSATSGTVNLTFTNTTVPAVGQSINLDGGKYIDITSVDNTTSAQGTVVGGPLSTTTFTVWTIGAALDPTTGWPIKASTWVMTVPASVLSTTIPGNMPPATYHGVVQGLSGAAVTPSVTGTGSTLTIDSVSGDTTYYTIVTTGAASCFLRYSAGISYACVARDGSSPTTTPGALFSADAIAYNAANGPPRLMDFSDTNATAYSQVAWADRPQHYAGAKSFVAKPYSWETRIAFLNAIAAYNGSTVRQAYLNFPAKADASYGAGLSALLNSYPLDPRISILDMEEGNEIWNPLFAGLSTNLQAAILEAQASLSSYAAVVSQIVSVVSDGAGTATVTLKGPCKAFYNASGMFITNGATAFFANTADTGFNAGSAGSPVTITVPSPTGNTFTYPISGATRARAMGTLGAWVGTFGSSVLPITQPLISLSTSDTSGVVTATTAFDLAYMTSAGLSTSGTPYVNNTTARFILSLGGSDQLWAVGTASSPATPLSVSLNTFTYQSAKTTVATLPAIVATQVSVIFNPTSNLVNDGLSSYGLFDLGKKYGVRQIYNFRTGWITNRPKASYPGDRFGFGIQLGIFASVGSYNTRGIHFDYAAFLGGGIGAAPSAAASWCSNAYGAPYAACGTKNGLTDNSGAPWETLTDLVFAVNSYIATYCTLMVRSFVYTCKAYGLLPVAYEAAPDVTFAPNLAVAWSTDTTGVVAAAVKANLDNWFKQGGQTLYSYMATPGGVVDIPFNTFVGSIAPVTAGTATASISGTTMTVPGAITGTFSAGMTLSGSGVTAGTTIVSQPTSTTYTVSVSQTVSSTTITATGSTLTVPSDPSSGALAVNQKVKTPAASGTSILSQTSGTSGKAGTYLLNISQTVSSQTLGTYVSTQTNTSTWSACQYYADTLGAKRVACDNYATGYSFDSASNAPGTLDRTNYVGLAGISGTNGANSYYWGNNASIRGFKWSLTENRTRTFVITPKLTDSAASTPFDVYMDGTLIGTCHAPRNGTGNGGAVPTAVADPITIMVPSGTHNFDGQFAAGAGALPGFGSIDIRAI